MSAGRGATGGPLSPAFPRSAAAPLSTPARRRSADGFSYLKGERVVSGFRLRGRRPVSVSVGGEGCASRRASHRGARLQTEVAPPAELRPAPLTRAGKAQAPPTRRRFESRGAGSSAILRSCRANIYTVHGETSETLRATERGARVCVSVRGLCCAARERFPGKVAQQWHHLGRSCKESRLF